ncbi:MAG: redox-regulated ATPase YchF [Nitrospirae bacterium]|nr:redox-regulated ATPase YchF [Nitrospirota bacterium]
MKLAIIGLSNSGRTTIFNALTGQDIETTIYPTTGGEPNIAVVQVPDLRVDKLSEIYKPKKTTYATVEYIDYIGLTKGDTEQNRKVYDLIKDVDAAVHVVRAFEDDAVAHPMGNIDARRDAEALELELIFSDLELVEKRLERIEQGAKRGKKPDEAEKRLLLKCKDALEKETALRDIEFNIDEQKAMRTLQFLSTKPEIVVINIGENDLNTEKASNLLKEVEGYFQSKYKNLSLVTRHSSLSLCGKVEMEIAQLLAEEARAFLDDLKIKEPVRNKLIRLSYSLLGLISFFTVGEDEVKAWTIKQGMEALKAAGKIHSDIERGFIRAEVIGFNEFIDSGASMAKAKEKGLLRLEGKNYIVKDGDIINFRFNI